MRISMQIHASSRRKLNWNSINWKTVETKVKELQMRIAKAVRDRKLKILLCDLNITLLESGQPDHLILRVGL